MKSKIRMGYSPNYFNYVSVYYTVGVSFQDINVPLRLRDSYFNYPSDNFPSDKVETGRFRGHNYNLGIRLLYLQIKANEVIWYF